MAAPSYPLVRFTLVNGLRVVVAPDRRAPVVGVTVAYEVGSRSEPEGRRGFAHLFEHLMFAGSRGVPAQAHHRFVQGAGGGCNAFTRQDHTSFVNVVPSNAVERVLFLEADRMAAPALSAQGLASQVAVVTEEAREWVLNVPGGTFPDFTLPSLLFDSYPNAHDGFSEIADLAAASTEDAAAFFRRFYVPSNAVLGIAGDVDAATARRLVEHHFGRVEGRSRPSQPSLSEPRLTGERRARQVDGRVGSPSVAVAWRVPDPIGELPAYLAFVVLAQLLAGGDRSWLTRRLVHQDQAATSVEVAQTFIGDDPFAVKDPAALIITVAHRPGVSADAVLDTISDEIGRLASDGVRCRELVGVRTRLAVGLIRRYEPMDARARAVAEYELLHSRGQLISELASLIAAVTDEQVRTAAATLRVDRRAVVTLTER